MFERGSRFAGYVIDQLIGVGRFAEVYRARDPDGARVALKVLKPEVAAPDAKPSARLGQEGEAVATIEHVSVVGYRGSAFDHGRRCLVLEYVEGVDLRRLVHDAGGALPVDRAVSIVRQACEGLAAAHALGILHRDLKPANILVAEGDRVKVADFGSAKLRGFGVKTTGTEQDLTSSLYAAPEFLQNSVAEPRSEVYVMAVVLYQLVTGKHPIAPEPMTAMTIVCRHLSYDPPTLASLDRGFPGDLSELLARAMSKDPTLRPSMRELADALAMVLWRLHAPRRALAREQVAPAGDGRLARTEPAMAAYGFTGVGATVPMEAFRELVEAEAASGRVSGAVAAGGELGGLGETGQGIASHGAATQGAPAGRGADGQGAPGLGIESASAAKRVTPSSDAALPPASGVPSTARSPSPGGPAPAIVAVHEVAPGAERARTGVAVASVVARPSRAPSTGARARAIGLVGATLVLGLLGAAWMLRGRGEGAPAGVAAAGSATAAPPAVSSPAASCSAQAPLPAVTADAGAPRPKAGPPVRPRTAPRSGLPRR
jgi:serine/threonine-protein kinase